MQEDVAALRKLAEEDIKNNVTNVKSILSSTESKETIIESVKSNVIGQMNNDRKSTALKQLQGHMWRSGYESGILKG